MKRRYWVLGTLLVIGLVFVGLIRLLPEWQAPKTEQSTIAQSLDETVPANSVEERHIALRSPAPDAVLNELPEFVEIEAAAPLTEKSSLIVTADGKEIASGAPELALDARSMRLELPRDTEPKTYEVVAHACWSDGTCTVDRYQFIVQ